MNIKIDTSRYRKPTEDEIEQARQFILKREDVAATLDNSVDTLLTDAAEKIAQICLKYNIPAVDFTLSYNSSMYREIEAVMDDLEDEIYSLIEDYSGRVTNDNGNKKLLLLWIATLGTSNLNLRQTLSGYMNRYLYDLEAIIAAYKLWKERFNTLKETTIISQIKSSLHSIYINPRVQYAIRQGSMKARYLITRGIHHDNIPLPIFGASSSNINNIIRFATTTMRMAWMREQLMEFRDNGAAGYIQIRSSNIPCELCDSEVGFYEGDFNDMLERPYPHPHCVCRRIPVYRKEE